MDTPVFSVIVTAYNQPDDIKRAVESVLNQTEKSFELIVVDDCSTDETPEVLAGYAEKNTCMRVIRYEKNGSSHAARCTGVENASGSYVIFLDGDDYLFPDALEKLMTQVVNGGKAFDVCEYSYQCQPSGEVINPNTSGNVSPRIDYFLRLDASVTIWNKLYRAEILKKAFSNMQKAYIRCGDDTYESICIAYFTKKFLQKNILVTNYVLGSGVSLRKNTFESNLRHCESLSTSLNSLKSFFDANSCENKEKLLNNIEKKYFDWILSVMKNNTELSDISRSLLLLPKYFDHQLILPHFEKLYSKQLKLKKIKLCIRSLLSAK